MMQTADGRKTASGLHPYTLRRAWLLATVGPADDVEGIVSLPGGLPAFTTDERHLPKLGEYAQRIAAASSMPIALCEFSDRIVVDHAHPGIPSPSVSPPAGSPAGPARIDTLWGFLATDHAGAEGVLTIHDHQDGAMPMIAADRARFASLAPLASKCAREYRRQGMHVLIVRWRKRVELASHRSAASTQ